MSRTRLLLVSMYPLDAGAWGPTTRISAPPAPDWPASWTSTSWSWAPVALRAVGQAARPRDVHLRREQLDTAVKPISRFSRWRGWTPRPDLRPRRAVPLRRVLRRQRGEAQARPGAVPPAVRLLRAVSSRTGYPSVGSAPRGAPFPVPAPSRCCCRRAAPSPVVLSLADARTLLFVGGMRYRAQRAGGRGRAGARRWTRPRRSLRLAPPEPRPAWLRVMHGESEQSASCLPACSQRSSRAGAPTTTSRSPDQGHGVLGLRPPAARRPSAPRAGRDGTGTPTRNRAVSDEVEAMAEWPGVASRRPLPRSSTAGRRTREQRRARRWWKIGRATSSPSSGEGT